MFIQILLLIVLILINGVFSASEIAFLSLRDVKVDGEAKRGNKKAQKIKAMLENPNIFLATIQIGITLAGFLASAFAAESFASEIVKHISFINLPYTVLYTTTVVLITIILSYFTLVFGELVPKRIGMAYSEKIAYRIINVISILSKISYPFVWILTKSTNLTLKLLRIENQEEKVTEDEIKNVLLKARETGALEPKEIEYIMNIFNFNDVEAHEVMTPIDRVIAIKHGASFREVFKTIKGSRFTRFLVYGNDLNDAVGILNIKNLILNFTPDKKFVLDDYTAKITSVDKHDKIDDIFKLMQDKNEHFAVVKNLDETIGIVTMEDLLETVVGNIFDEFDGGNKP